MSMLSKWKLTRILQSKSNVESTVSAIDIVEGYVHNSKHKRGKWTSSCTVFSFEPRSWTFTVLSTNGKTMKPAIDVVQIAVHSK